MSYIIDIEDPIERGGGASSNPCSRRITHRSHRATSNLVAREAFGPWMTTVRPAHQILARHPRLTQLY